MVLIQLGIMVIGFVLLIKGADFFVKGASAIAHKFGVPQIVIGLTVVAMGTSAPEAAVSISAALSGNADITIGNVLGSNIMNVLVILGITALVAPLTVDRSAVKSDMPVMLGTTLLLLPLGLLGGSVNRWEGLLLLAVFAAYMVDLFRDALKHRDEEGEQRPTYGQGNAWTILMTLGGLIMIVLGSRLTVSSATEIAQYLGVSQRMIGLTVVAFGTSLPELVTSVTAARRGNTGIAIGNIVGSNIFNILFVTGLTAAITPIAFLRDFTFDLLVAALAALLLWVFSFKSGFLGRPSGIVFVVLYAAYFTVIVLNLV
ncbi:MAG: calcium/sodium antiporter [Firmicutes bacterium]|nr:calcium/sodium antiporter [Bacillota bacterium]